MHSHPRRRFHEEEEESAFVSMTDMTVGFLFIVILLLAFFASRFSSEDSVTRAVYEMVRDERDHLAQALRQVQTRLAEAEADLAQAHAELAAAADRIAEFERHVADLEEKNAALEQSVAALKREISALEGSVAALEGQVAALEEELARLNEQLRQKNPLEVYGAGAADVRRQMLERLAGAVQADITREQIMGLTVTAQGDALRFQGSGLFASGASTLTGASRQVVRLLGEHLDRELPCFSVGPQARISATCNPQLVLFETIQVEGHTDSVGGTLSNLNLSAGRALAAYAAIVPDMEADAPQMLGYENLLGQPLLAFAGYGEMRPIVDEATGDGSANRRIDLRFIMYVPPGVEYIPHNVSDLEGIGRSLRLRAGEG